MAILPLDQQTDDFDPAAWLAAMPSLPRSVLVRITEALIDRMDELDDDPDLEPEDDMCIAGDDGRSLRHDQFGKPLWGSEHYAILPMPPVYADDQTGGPTNQHEAHREHQAAVMGLVRTPTGWRLPT